MFTIELQGVRLRVAFEHRVLHHDEHGQHRRTTRCWIWPVDADDRPQSPGCVAFWGLVVYQQGEAFDRSRARKIALQKALSDLTRRGDYRFAREFTKEDRRAVWAEYFKHCPLRKYVTLKVPVISAEELNAVRGIEPKLQLEDVIKQWNLMSAESLDG